MYWRHRVNIRDLIQSVQENQVQNKNISKFSEELAERLEIASIFRKSDFPKRLRSIDNLEDLNTTLEELYEFSHEEKVWLGL